MRAWIGWSLMSLPRLMLWDSVISVKAVNTSGREQVSVY